MITTKLTLDDVRLAAPAAFALSPHPRVSDRYRFFSTAQVLEPLIAKGWFPSRVGQARAYEANRRYTNHYVALTRPDLIYGGEQIEALLFNSHDGRKKLHFELGVFRGICANGMVWSDDSFGELNLRHLHYSPDEVIEACETIASHAPQVVERIDAWKNLLLDAGKERELAQLGLSLRWPKNPPIKADDLLFVRRWEDEKPTLWNVFNRVQESITKGGNVYAREGGKQVRGTTRAVSSISAGLNINKRLWSGAQAIADGLALPA